MSDVSAALPRAGWYPDPAGPGGWRWRTGQAWSAQTRTDLGSPPAPAPRPSPAPYAVIAARSAPRAVTAP